VSGLVPLELPVPRTPEDFEDFCIAVANEARHNRPVITYWARRSGKTRIAERVAHLLGDADVSEQAGDGYGTFICPTCRGVLPS